jgi:RNase adaptor protein for sRNA GlmZ degradation
MIRLISAGKSEVLNNKVQADLYLDCRVIWNPFRDPVLGGLNGDSPKLQEWLREKNDDIIQAYKRAVTLGEETRKFRNSGKDPSKPFTVCFFCLAGVHRSRGMKNVIGQDLKAAGYEVTID